MERLEEDRKTSHVMYKLLLAIDEDMLQVLVDNTLGYKYENNSDFRRNT